MPGADVTILTESLSLGPIDDSDLEHIWTATRHPGFNDGMLWEAPATREDMADWTRKTLELEVAGKQYTLTARGRLEGRFIGRVSVRPVEGVRIYRVGFWVHPAEWNKGYATEIAAGALAFAFDGLKAEIVAVAHAVWNKASARVIEKTGFQYSRDIAEGFKKKGAWVAEREYVMDATRWSSMRPNLSIQIGRSQASAADFQR